jgi:hypothetical protein
VTEPYARNMSAVAGAIPPVVKGWKVERGYYCQPVDKLKGGSVDLWTRLDQSFLGAANVREVSQVLRRLKAQGIKVGAPKFVGSGERVTREVDGVAVHYKNHSFWVRKAGSGVGIERRPDVTVDIYERPGSEHVSAAVTSRQIMSALQAAIPRSDMSRRIIVD